MSKNQNENNWRLLYIDDDEDDLLVVRLMLSKSQPHAIFLDTALTPEEGRHKLNVNDYHAVLIDYDLGRETGIEIIREFVRQGYSAPFILLTGRGSYDVDLEALHAGATMYLTKAEINPLLLERSIRYAIERKLTEEDLRRARDEFKRREALLQERENAILQSRAILEAALGSMTEAVLISDAEGNFIDFNDAFVTFHHCKSKQECPRSFAEFLEFLDLLMPDGTLTPVEMWPVSRALRGEKGMNVEYSLRRKDTGATWVGSYSFAPIRNPDGAIVGSVVVSHDISEQKQAEAMLKERSEALRVQSDALSVSEARFSLAAKASNNAIWDWDLVDDSIQWNEAVSSLFGYPASAQSNSSGDWWKERIHPDDYDSTIESLEEVIHNGGVVWAASYRFRRADGSYAEVEDRGWMVRNGTGQPLRMVGAMRDVTHRNEADRALRNSEARFRQLADAMPQLVWTADPDGTVDYYNKRYQLYGGISPQEGERWEWRPVLHPDELEPTINAWERALETGQIYEIEHRVCMADGGYRWHLSRGVPARDDQGRIIKWYGTATDIDDLKQTQERLRLQEKRLQTLVDAKLIGIASRDESGKILDANDAYLEIAGYSRQDVESGKLNIQMLTPEEFQHLDQQATIDLLEKGYCKPYEKVYIRKDGTRIPVLIGYALLDTEPKEFIGFVLDLGELKKAQADLAEKAKKLQRSNEDLERFAFVASHDLQEPLRKLMLFGSILRKELDGSLTERAEDTLNRMESAAFRMQGMINGLLSLSRVSTHGRKFEPVNMTNLAEDVISDLEPRIDATQGKVILEDLPAMEGDPLQLRQLLQNLISNGLKFHKPEVPPVVHVSGGLIRTEDTPLGLILVEDNGIGFDGDHNANRVFQPFIRLHGRDEYEGSGIGLAICRKIVERHGGTIIAESKPGQGSRFTITMPVRQ